MYYYFYLFTATVATQGHKKRGKALCCFLKEGSDSVNVDIKGVIDFARVKVH